MAEARPTDHMIEAGDGLKLHVREWRPEAPRGPVVACLPGLARTLEDFATLAAHLSSPDGGGFRVIAISARGRGLSDRDPDPARYELKTESEDAIAVLAAMGVARAAIVGTSRGGLQAMMIAALKPELPVAAVLNDVGPVLEPDGLKRVRDALADRFAPRDWAEAVARLQAQHGERFPALGPDDFARWARRAWREGPDGLEPACDPALAVAVASVDFNKPLPPLWPLFDALARVPLMVVRGGTSDLLSAGSLAEMADRRPDLAAHIVPGQGHAPLLDDLPTMEAIAGFLAAKSS